MDDLVTYMGYEWVQIEENILTIGINEEGLEEFNEINKVDLPSEGMVVGPDEICGEIDTDQGPMNIYSPVEGTVTEINETVLSNPSVILDDNFGDGWLFRVESDNQKQIDQLTSGRNEDEDDDDEEEKDRDSEESAE